MRVAGGRISVKGRLMTIDGFELTTTAFPTVEAKINATVYLTPKGEGTTAGATPDGPAGGASGTAIPAANPAR